MTTQGMDPVDYRALFWQAFGGLQALEWGARGDCGLCEVAQLRILRGATTTWRKRIEDQLPEAPDEAGWPTNGPCAHD